MLVRKHLPRAWTSSGPSNPSNIAPPRVSSVPRPAEMTSRRIEMEVTDTAEGKVRAIHYGRFRFSTPLVHFDIVASKLEILAIVGEGPILAIDYVWVDEVQVYPSPPAWAEVETRLGGTYTQGSWSLDPDQAPVTIISNATIKDWIHPGQAYVAIRINPATASIQGAIPRVEVQGRGLFCEDLSSMDPEFKWTENPIWHLADAMMSDEYGAGIPRSAIATGAMSPVTDFSKAAIECESAITYETLETIGQQTSDQQLLLSTYDRLQSFKAPSRGFKIEVLVRAVSTSLTDAIGFPCVIRTSADGTDIPPDLVSTPVLPTANADYTMWGLWFDTHDFLPDQTLYLVSRSSGQQVSVGPTFPVNGTDDATVGTVHWNNPEHITTDELAATDLSNPRAQTHYLMAANYGFSIPAGATISGIELRIRRKAYFNDDIGDDAVDAVVKLMKGYSIGGSNKADTSTHWPTSEVTKTYGGQYDLWGLAWTPADINAVGFGAVLSASIAGPCTMGQIAYVRQMTIKVYYTLPGGGQAANEKWHHNSVSNLYADGKAQYKNVTWFDQNYDHWFRVTRAEMKHRCALSIIDRQPIELVAKTILRTCHGRFGWWDGAWRVALDALAAGTASPNLLSDNQASIETDATPFSAYHGGVLSRVTTEHWRGSACLKITCDGSQGGQGGWTTFSTSEQGTYVGSIRVMGTPGKLLNCFTTVHYTDASETHSAGTAFALNGLWQELPLGSVVSNPAKTVDGVKIQFRQSGAQGIMVYYVDGLQLERGAYPTVWRLPSSTMLVMSDRESDYPDIPILADTLVCGTNEGDQPNFTAATYLDVEDWKRKTVRYTDPLYELGTQQSKELRNDGAPVPAAGNLYRLLATWLRRVVRSWRGSCRATQHGFVLAPGDLFLLKSMLFSSSRVVMVEDIQDEKDGTLTISFCEWSADDFVAVPYLAQAIVATTTA